MYMSGDFRSLARPATCFRRPAILKVKHAPSSLRFFATIRMFPIRGHARHTRSGRAQHDYCRPRQVRWICIPKPALKPGMQAVAWTTFQGTKPEAVPVEIIGIWQNAWGPKAGHHSGPHDGKSVSHQRRWRHERQPGLYRWQTRRRGLAAAQRLSRRMPSAASRRYS